MRHCTCLRPALLTAAALANHAAAAQGVTHIQAGAWTANDFLDSANPGCSVGVDASQPGSRMILGVSRRQPDPANLVFRQTSWTIRQGLPITILATFDATLMRVEGVGNGKTISVDLSGETLRSWVHNLTAASTLRLTYLGGTTPMWTIDLTGSSTVVNAMGDCVRSHQLAGVGAPFSLALAAPSTTPYAPQAPSYVPSSPLVTGGATEDAPPAPASVQPAYVPSPPSVPGSGRAEAAPTPTLPSQTGPVFPPSADPVLANWSGSDNIQTRPFHVDGAWELQWINGKGHFSINVHPLRSSRSDLVANTINAGQSTHFYPDGGDFYLEVDASAPWGIRAVSLAPNTPAESSQPTQRVTAAPVPSEPTSGLMARSTPAQEVSGGGTPRDEAVFITAAQSGQQSFNNAPSDFAQGASRPTRKLAICRALPSPVVQNWVGTLTTLTTNGDGKGVISIEIAPDIHLKTWNNALSDIGSSTLVEPGSPVYQSMSSLRTGQKVRFSGRLVASDTDCVQESSITLRGSMTAPEFLIRFEQIEGL